MSTCPNCGRPTGEREDDLASVCYQWPYCQPTTNDQEDHTP